MKKNKSDINALNEQKIERMENEEKKRAKADKVSLGTSRRALTLGVTGALSLGIVIGGVFMVNKLANDDKYNNVNAVSSSDESGTERDGFSPSLGSADNGTDGGNGSGNSAGSSGAGVNGANGANGANGSGSSGGANGANGSSGNGAGGANGSSGSGSGSSGGANGSSGNGADNSVNGADSSSLPEVIIDNNGILIGGSNADGSGQITVDNQTVAVPNNDEPIVVQTGADDDNDDADNSGSGGSGNGGADSASTSANGAGGSDGADYGNDYGDDISSDNGDNDNDNGTGSNGSAGGADNDDDNGGDNGGNSNDNGAGGNDSAGGNVIPPPPEGYEDLEDIPYVPYDENEEIVVDSSEGIEVPEGYDFDPYDYFS